MRFLALVAGGLLLLAGWFGMSRAANEPVLSERGEGSVHGTQGNHDSPFLAPRSLSTATQEANVSQYVKHPRKKDGTIDPVVVVEELDKYVRRNGDIVAGAATFKHESGLIEKRIGDADPDDTGIAQINLRHHPGVAKECALDYVCAIRQAARIGGFLDDGDGNWGAWHSFTRGHWKQYEQEMWLALRTLRALQAKEKLEQKLRSLQGMYAETLDENEEYESVIAAAQALVDELDEVL